MLGLAVLVDRVAGEPPAELHPVVWIGNMIAALESHAPASRPQQLLYGGTMAAAVPAVAALSAAAAARLVGRLPGPLRVLALSTLLKPSFALRALAIATAAVERDLERDDLGAAREDLRSLVSRDTARLDAHLAAAAAIESVAENLTDSVVAPLLAFAVAGLPGAYCYRAINTLDSMIGYHGRYEWLGKASARLDDAVNLLPARIAALLLIVGASLRGGDVRGAWQVLHAEHGTTESPNAGWTMTAMAGALGVQLEKRGHYVLNAAGRPPEHGDLRAARQMIDLASLAAGLIGACIIVARGRKAKG